MFSESAHAHPAGRLEHRTPGPASMALLVGLGLGLAARLLWPGLAGLAGLALWPSTMAAALFAIGLIHIRYRRDAMWGMLIGGQLMGVVAIGMFLIASMA